MAVNKIVYNTENGPETLIDLTSDTVTPETLAEGATAHDASGRTVTGTMATTSVLYTAQTLTDAQKEQARNNIGTVSTAYMTSVFEELKTALEEADIAGAIAVLDEAILDLSTVA
jgi:hypothetical protein